MYIASVINSVNRAVWIFCLDIIRFIQHMIQQQHQQLISTIQLSIINRQHKNHPSASRKTQTIVVNRLQYTICYTANFGCGSGCTEKIFHRWYVYNDYQRGTGANTINYTFKSEKKMFTNAWKIQNYILLNHSCQVIIQIVLFALLKEKFWNECLSCHWFDYKMHIWWRIANHNGWTGTKHYKIDDYHYIKIVLLNITLVNDLWRRKGERRCFFLK